MANTENLYNSAVNRLKLPDTLLKTGPLSEREKSFYFAMQCNGYFKLKSGHWFFAPETLEPFVKEFEGQKVSFFGPDCPDVCFSGRKLSPMWFTPPFKQEQVAEVIGKYRKVDENQAARIAFIFGSIVRHFGFKTAHSYQVATKIATSVEFAARMTRLGEQKSGDAVASAIAMYIFSNGSLTGDNHFLGQVYHMVDAISDDPIRPFRTEDLGLSQVARLHTFLETVQGKKHQGLPDIQGYQKEFDDFPTVGAEFHLPVNTSENYPTFWQRLALLNMSQYQPGSHIQLSRNDRGVIEIRNNPSVYPITVANWKHMRLLLPELNKAYFTITINSKSPTEDFSWCDRDRKLLDSLRALGMLTYAGLFKGIPHTKNPGEVNLGEVYLGQTVKMHGGKYKFSGHWGAGEGESGQLGIFAGFGDNLPHLAYYLSMGFTNPDILRADQRYFLSSIKTLQDAFAVDPAQIREVFDSIQNCVQNNKTLKRASDAGKKIIELLSPQ